MNNKHLIYGCMFSGKTTKMQSLIKHCKLSFAIFVHPLQNKFTTHDMGVSSAQFHMPETYEEMCEYGKDKQIWFIDEVQFYPISLVMQLIKRPEIMYFTGLDSDFNGNDFPTTKFLINTIESTRLKAICECGAPAVHSKLLGDKPNGNILIGGCDKYKPACSFCFY